MRQFKLFLVLFTVVAFFSIPSYVLAGHGMENPCAANPCAANTCAANACNPCAANACNPCAANACNPCAANACNPCATNACNPCAAKQPCGAQPCGAQPKIEPIREEGFGSVKEAIALGKKLWNDPSLGTSKASCNLCHMGGKSFNKTFTKHYPHYVKMPNDVVTLPQMINFCMINPMKGEPLPWNSREMTALSAYIDKVAVKEFRAMLKANPCALKNPCAVNPCAANPCAANPCAANPCAANPCAANPCTANPCSMK